MSLIHHRFLLPVLTATTLATRAPEEVRYAPAAGATLERTWTFETSSEVDEFTLSLMGQDQSIGDDVTRESKSELVVRDTIHGVEGGRPTRLDRTLLTLSRDSDLSGVSGEGVQVRDRDDQSSELQDQTVVFEWDKESELFAPRYAEGSAGEPEWLSELAEDMDLRALLPDGPVEPGATWEVEPAVLDELLQPGGRLGVFAPVSDPDAPEGGLAIRLPDPGTVGRYCDLPGEVVVRFVGVEGTDTGRVAKLELTAKVAGSLDVAELLDERAEAEGVPPNDYDEADLERTLEGHGVLTWDLARNRMRSLTFEAKTTSTFSAAWSVGAGEHDLPIEVTQVAHGSLAIAAEVADAE